MNTAPIGIFDSGMGGLTIVRAINKLLPHENLIYFGDTKHTPWGDKSTATIQGYATRICEVLLAQQCKAIVIACHTASAVANTVVQQQAAPIPVINVVDPVLAFICQNFKAQTIGLIGTKQTVASNHYYQKLQDLDPSITLQALATPLLVPLIEEGMAELLPTKLILEQYLANPNFSNIKALILGCTHYPLLKDQIINYYKQQIAIIDATELTALSLQKLLAQQQLLNPSTITPQHTFYISDHNPHFIKLARLFFTADLKLLPYLFAEQETMGFD